MMMSTLKMLVPVLALILPLTAAKFNPFDNPDDPMGNLDAQMPDPSIPLWGKLLPSERKNVDPPYTPPKDWRYNTAGKVVDGKINVHLVPHTHDDTGWQVTVDQYYFQNVYFVIDTVVDELLKDENRKFIYVETAFFARWWEEQTPERQAQARQLVENKQLEFINGGWCMHDEASPYYVEMIDQTTRGHQWLKKNLGDKASPRATWSIDPFGHSNTQAWLLGAKAGMQGMWWGRTDYQDFNARKPESKLEWVWQGSQSLGGDASIFAGSLYGTGGGGYGSWFNFDTNGQTMVQDNPERHDYNVDQFVDAFIQDALAQAAETATDHQMWALGNDFNYQNADRWYRNLDKLLHYVNLNGTVNVLYSSPTVYMNAKYASDPNRVWEIRQDDIFPLADGPHRYWTGYFTSRPSLKLQVRRSSAFLNAVRQVREARGRAFFFFFPLFFSFFLSFFLSF